MNIINNDKKGEIKMSDYKLKTPKWFEKVTEVYQKIEDTVVGTYQKIEDGVVGTYQKIEDKFVDTFMEKVEPETEEVKEDTAEKTKTEA